MIEKIIKNKIKIRIIVFVVLSLLAYGFTIFYLFGSHDVFASIVCIFFLFIFFHFMSLDIKRFKKRYILLILLSLMIIDISVLVILNWEVNIWLILSIVLLNASLFALFSSLKMADFRSIQYFLRGGYVFTLLITITYSVALIGMFQKFPFTCEGLQGASDKLIDFVEMPFAFSVDRINSFASEDAVAILSGVEEKLEIQYSSQSGHILLDEKVENVLLKAKSIEVLPDSNSDISPIVWQFNEWKSKAVDQIMGQQESYSLGMCDMLLDEINAKYDLKEFKLSAILLTYLLLFGFVRVAIFIMSLIGFIIFKLLYLVGLYKVKKIKKEVNEVM